jgi:peptide/nickel transport system substrate-binding protein
MKKLNFIHFSFLLLLVAAFIFACSGNKSSGNELRYGFVTEPTTLDPLNSSNTADGRCILFNVFEGLVKPDVDGTFLPCIAESWTIEQDASVYNFLLRENVYFHDGSLLTPSDVKFSLDTARNRGFDSLKNIKEVNINGSNRINVILINPDPEFLPYLTVGIVKADVEDREKNIIGAGPFSVDSYTPQRNLVLVKFDKYWQSNLPHLNKITLVFFGNYDTLLVALRGGSIDGAFITGSMAAQLDHRLFDVFNNRSAAVQLMALNNSVSPLNDLRVRKAINYGINVYDIIDTAFFGAGSPSGSPIIPGLSVYYEDSLSYEYNPDLARSLLEDAGFNASNKFSLEITVPSNYAMHIDTAQVIVSHLDRIGVNASIKLVDWSTWLSDVYFGRQYQATIISLDSASVSPRSFLTRYQSASGSNFIGFKNHDLNNVYNTILTETDTDKRIKLYKDAQRIIAENAASVYIQDIFSFIALRKGAYGGVLDYPLYVVDFSSIYGISNN